VGFGPKTVHQRIQTGRGASAGTRGLDGGSVEGVGSQRERATPLASGVPERNGQRLSGQLEAAPVGRPNRGTGTQSRPAGFGDRFFERVLAAHRGAADAAGTDWKSAVYGKVQEEVKTVKTNPCLSCWITFNLKTCLSRTASKGALRSLASIPRNSLHGSRSRALVNSERRTNLAAGPLGTETWRG